MEGFYVEAVRRLTGMRLRMVEGGWAYPHSADVLKAAGLCTVEEYIAKRRANIAKTIEGRRILEECRGQRDGEAPQPAHTGGSRS